MQKCVAAIKFVYRMSEATFVIVVFSAISCAQFKFNTDSRL